MLFTDSLQENPAEMRVFTRPTYSAMRHLFAPTEITSGAFVPPVVFPVATDKGTSATKRSSLGRMPKWLICIPLVLQWLWLALRYQSLTLPTVANPAITSGGLVGEGKLEYFENMGPIALSATAAYCPVSNHKHYTGKEIHDIMLHAGLSFPVVAKPNVGLCGHGVQLIGNHSQLLAYMLAFPVNETVVLQHYLPQDGEAGIFYSRDPNFESGSIIGLALRYYPRVVGDGKRTVAELIARDPRAQRLLKSSRHESGYNPGDVPSASEVVRLATIGSTRVGGLYCDGHAHITPQLTRAIDAIARDMPSFYFGRFDVRFDSLSELAEGRGFSIMEINGAGSEAIQAWDPQTSMTKGFQAIFKKQRILFAIGDVMRSKGFKPLGVLALARLNRRQNRLIAQYPPSN